MNKVHSSQTIVNGLHGIAAFTYPTSAVRLAAGPFQSYDIYKVAVQLDDNSLWILKSVSPIVWDTLGGGSTQDLSNVLLIGNSTNGTNIVVSSGDDITLTDAPVAPTDGVNKAYADSTLLGSAIASASQGDLLYFNGSNWVKLSAGTSGYFLTTNGPGANPSWSMSGGGTPTGPAGGDLTGTYPNPTIDVNKVTFAKIQQIATDSLLGRDTTGTGNVENITLNSTLVMNGSQVLGRAAISGDVTIAAGSNTSSIGANVIVDADINASAGIAVSKLEQIAGISVLGRSANTLGIIAPITATVTGQPLVYNGTTIGFGSPNFGALNITSTGSLTIAGITNSGAYAGGTNPAASGIIRLPNANNIRFRNAANSADIDALAVNSSNQVILGNSSDTAITLDDSTDTVSLRTAGVIQLAIDANSVDAQDNYITTTSTIRSGISPAGSGQIRIPNNTAINARNAANSGDLILLSSNSSDTLILGNGSTHSYSITTGGTHNINVANSSKVTITSSVVSLGNPTLRFDETQFSPFITQNADNTASIIADPLTIGAQNATGTTSTGGKLVLQSGTGTFADGYVTINKGPTKVFEADNNNVKIGDTSVIMLEIATLSAKNIVSLCLQTPLTNFEMPANSGSGVVFLAKSGSVPTANPNNGVILYCGNTGSGGNFTTRSGFGNMILGDRVTQITLEAGTTGHLLSCDFNKYALSTTIAGSTANVGLFTSAGSFGGGEGVLYMANRVTQPTTTPSGGGILYVQGGQLRFKGGSGTDSLVAPA